MEHRNEEKRKQKIEVSLAEMEMKTEPEIRLLKDFFGMYI